MSSKAQGGARTLLSPYIQWAVACPAELKDLLPELPSSSVFDTKLTRQMDTREIVPSSAIPVFPSLPDRAFKAFNSRREGAHRGHGQHDEESAGTRDAAAATELTLREQLETFNFRDIPHLTAAERAFLDALDEELFTAYQRAVLEAYRDVTDAEVLKARQAEQRFERSGLFDPSATSTLVHALIAVDVVPRGGAANLRAVAHRVLRRFMAAGRRGTLATEAAAAAAAAAARESDDAGPEAPLIRRRRQEPGQAAVAGAADERGPLSPLTLAAQSLGAPAAPSANIATSSTFQTAAAAASAADVSTRALGVWKAQAGRALEDGPGIRRIWAAERGIHPTAASMQLAVRAAAAGVSTLVPAAPDSPAGRAVATSREQLQHITYEQRRAELYADCDVVEASRGGNAAGLAVPGGTSASSQASTLLPPIVPDALRSIAAMQTRLEGASLNEQARRRRAARAAAAALGSPGGRAPSPDGSATATVRRRLEASKSSGRGSSVGATGGQHAHQRMLERGVVAVPRSTPPGGGPLAPDAHDSARAAADVRDALQAPNTADATGRANELFDFQLTAAALPVPDSGVRRESTSTALSHASGAQLSSSCPRSPLVSGASQPSARGAQQHRSPLQRAGSVHSLHSPAAVRGGMGARRMPATTPAPDGVAAPTPAFHRTEVLDAVASLLAPPARGQQLASQVAEDSGALDSAAAMLRHLRASASASRLSGAAEAAKDASLGLLRGADLPSTLSPDLRASVASLRRTVEASMKLASPVADRIVALGAVTGARVGPLSSPLRPIRVPRPVALPASSATRKGGAALPAAPDVEDADTATDAPTTGRPGTRHSAAGGSSTSRRGGSPPQALDSALGYLGADRGVDGIDEDAKALAVAEAQAAASSAAAAEADRTAALTRQLSQVMDLLEMPVRERAGFVARYSGSRGLAGGLLREACGLWGEAAQGVVHAEVLKHALAHVRNAREALTLALRIAKQDAPLPGELAEEPAIWVPVVPAATLDFAASRRAITEDAAAWAEEQLALTPANAPGAYYLWCLPSRPLQPQKQPPAGQRDKAGSVAAAAEEDAEEEEEGLAAIAAAAVVAGRATFPPLPALGPPLCFRPVFRSGARSAEGTATTLAALAVEGAEMERGGGASASAHTSFKLRLQAQEPAVGEVHASEARIAAMLDGLRTWLSDACLEITGRYGDAVAFRGVNVLAALRREARAGLIPESDLRAAMLPDEPDPELPSPPVDRAAERLGRRGSRAASLSAP